MAEKKEITLLGVGDFNLNREDPRSTFVNTLSLLKSADISFGQLEAAISDRPSGQVHAPSICCVPSKNASCVGHAGFNVISVAGNHTLDSGVDAMQDTIEILRRNGIAAIGAGMNIEEARKPAILERKGTKIGFLAFNMVIPAGYAATATKPGCNPIRVTTFYEQVDGQPGTPPNIVTIPNPQDVEAMEEAIRTLKAKVDVVVLSMHWGIHFQQAVIPMYEFQVGHLAIDAGADLILGTHAHILKGIEVYKGKVIFHSLCNFGMDAFMAKQMKAAHSQVFFKLYKYKPDPEYTTYPFPPDSRKSIIAKAVIADRKIQQVSYLPIWINKESVPELLSAADSRFGQVNDYVAWLSTDQELDTRFGQDGNEINILT